MNSKPRLQSLPSRLGKAAPRVAAATTGTWRGDKASSTARGYGYKWQQARLGHLRSHPLCVYCDRQDLVTEATVVDHIIPHRGDMGLFWDRKNWQSLCATCHSGMKAREEAAGGAQQRIPRGSLLGP